MESYPIPTCRFELRFDSLFREGHGFAFPCDQGGHVDLDALSDAALSNYLFARATTGRDFAVPRVQPVTD